MNSKPTNTDSGLLAPVWAGTTAADLTGDEAWLQAMLDVEVALARAQSHLGVIPAQAATVIAEAAHADRIDLPALAAGARGAANPVVLLVQALTAEVTRIDHDAAEYVHRGGTSQDILDSAAMLIATRVFTEIEQHLTRTADALARLADNHRTTPMAGRTLTQHAVPITFGLKAAGWLTLVLDAIDRVHTLRTDRLPAQLGGAAGTLASYLEYAAAAERHGHAAELSVRFAQELGLTEAVVPWHALRTPMADIGAVCTFVTTALGKIALDVQGMARTEVAELAEPGAEGRGVSSAMPQKQNPVLATLLTSAARQAPLYATVLSQAMLAEDERSAGAWHAEWQPLRECLRLTGGAAATAAELAAGLRVFPDVMQDNLKLTGGSIVSERLNVALAPHLGKANAKKLLARIAADDRPFEQALLSAPELVHLDPADLRQLLDPVHYLGASEVLVDRVLARQRKQLGNDAISYRG
ncbi:3-carboxy-cis,cis-muconate cycloisomerase [Saccharothrix sp. ALI-22-I]|uniref:class-II fumarase/aspartase family protein n=1 Tax=Saccharothrix sp. ALI-22-I TaxID=1933778 RepID=UPI00097C22A7|nr:adenylosuccinate lyase family protein [Saccharothrix sp. ALI-22-I]ONI90954.1 3-carboxy-cis,cis-muconate cycloisomerase [Saccharothrix sp. ALI-22-I]